MRWALVALALLAGPAAALEADAAAAPTAPPPPVDARAPAAASLDLGVLHHELSAGYPAWNGVFARGAWHVHPRHTLRAELAWLREFGDEGLLAVAGDTFDLSPRWFVAGALATSAGGFFLPRWRADLDVSRKWLPDGQLVTTVGGSFSGAKDAHRDRALTCAAALYLPHDLVLEAGARLAWSDPGAVFAPSGFGAVTWGRDGARYLSLRLGAGREAYQPIAEGAAIVDFASVAATATWREWLGRRWGLQLRLDAAHNPVYDRGGLELGAFWELG